MKEQIIEILSSELDKELISDLVESYAKIKRSYILGEYEETQAKSGKFVENVFRLLYFIRTKNVITEIKQQKINDELDKLRSAPSENFSESIRILIPEISNTLIYLTRSKLGSVHVKPIKPDLIDAKLTVEACNWIIAELLRTYHKRDTELVENLIKNVIQEEIPIIQKIGQDVFINAKLNSDKEILIRLFDSDEGLTREELGKFMKVHFSPGTITKALIKLIKNRNIHLTHDQKYVVADSQRKTVSDLIETLSNQTKRD